MAIEIERKFLVKSEDFKTSAYNVITIKQGYLSSNPSRSVRIRIKGEKAFITIKGKSNENGTVRFEWEKEIDKSDAESLLRLCEPGIIEKNRYEVNNGRFIFEVDEFFGENTGLIVAEIELTSEMDDFDKPLWLGDEVTGDTKYYNSMLIKNPFKNW